MLKKCPVLHIFGSMLILNSNSDRKQEIYTLIEQSNILLVLYYSNTMIKCSNEQVFQNLLDHFNNNLDLENNVKSYEHYIM